MHILAKIQVGDFKMVYGLNHGLNFKNHRHNHMFISRTTFS